MLLPLELLDSGDWADVAEVRGESSWVTRLAEMGVRAGSRILLLQPGSPCLFQIGGTRMSLRGDLAMQILVQPVGRSG
jgi:Fe2+ transport system protein FeoA